MARLDELLLAGLGSEILGSPDKLYWRRLRHGEPEIQYIEMENIHFYQGEGRSVDGFYYWSPKLRGKNTVKLVKRVPLEIWIRWGRAKHSPPEEKPKGLPKNPYARYRSSRSKEQLRL